MQPVSVQTIQDNIEVAGAGCTLTNDNGRWFVTSPGSVTIQKSTADLAVECSKANAGIGHETAVSKANGSAWGNILLGGPIGYAMDRTSGAGFDYPSIITVTLRKAGEAAGVAPPIESQKNQASQQNDSQTSKTITTAQVEPSVASANTTSATPTSVNTSVSQKLRELQSLRKNGLITEDEFQSKKQQLLDKL